VGLNIQGATAGFTTSCLGAVSEYECTVETISDDFYKPLLPMDPANAFPWSYLLSDMNFLDESSASNGWDCFAGYLANSDCSGACDTQVESQAGLDNLEECVAFAALPWHGHVGSLSYDPREGGTCTLFADNAIYHNTQYNPRLQNEPQSEPWHGYCDGHFSNGNTCVRRDNTCNPQGCPSEDARAKQAYFCVPPPVVTSTSTTTQESPQAPTDAEETIQQLQEDVETLKTAVAALIAQNQQLTEQMGAVNVLNIQRRDDGVCVIGCDNGLDGGELQLE
jgi:hypothetical protein